MDNNLEPAHSDNISAEFTHYLNLAQEYISKENISVETYILQRINDMSTGSLLYNGHRYADNSIRNLKKLYRLWVAFEHYYNCYQMTFDEVTPEIYNKFALFCDLKKYTERTKHLYISLFNSLINSGLNDKIHSNKTLQSKKINTKITYKTSHVFLEPYEIVKIEKVNLKKDPKLSKIRDMFLLGCYTGQRFSDYSEINESRLITLASEGKSYKAFKIQQKKTRKTVIIPIFDKKVLETMRRCTKDTEHISLRIFNRGIKEICKLAGINQETKVTENKGGKIEDKTGPKYRFISSHTARRSFITNLYLSGKLSLGQIRSMSGHSSEESLKIYLCQSLEEQAISIINTISFTK